MPLRDVTNTIPTPADASSDGEDWGSDFGDDNYTVEELTAFRLRFEREEEEIANAQRHWFASPAQGRGNHD
ncbi:hypothetical protein [Stenotrophomonas sp. AB1(2024)]|uniref:hypothetical protein n=1 Tax=Stenotrophomonas sp. AB1(2024) TaxID=3132215 RepID=UPI00309DAC68